jgi:hypothetical protein
MQDYDNLNSYSRNAFALDFLKRIGEVDEPLTAAEADMAGPWVVEEVPGAGFGLYRAGEGNKRGFRPFAVVPDRSLALLLAAILPGTGQDAAFRLRQEAEGNGFAFDHGTGGVAGHLALFDERAIDALHVVNALIRSPESLANLLEAAGGLALERAGAILDSRFPESGPQPK